MKRLLQRRVARIAVAAASAGTLVATGVAAHAALSGPSTPATTAESTVVGFTGNGVTAVDVATDRGIQAFNAPTWKPVAGSGVTVTVPSGNWRLASSTFSGWTFCVGTDGGYCSMRIVARKSGTTSAVQFYPQAGLDYAIDAGVGEDMYEGHSLDRSKTLAPGTWRVWAEASTSDSTTEFRVGAWHHRVMIFAR